MKKTKVRTMIKFTDKEQCIGYRLAMLEPSAPPNADISLYHTSVLHAVASALFPNNADKQWLFITNLCHFDYWKHSGQVPKGIR